MARKVNIEVVRIVVYSVTSYSLYYEWHEREGRMGKLGNYIKQRRDRLGWTRAELARESNVPHTTIRNIENNPRDVKPEETTLEALAAAFGEDPIMLKILAGYTAQMNTDVSTFSQRIDALRKTSPRWEKALNAIQDEMSIEEQGQALTALEIHVEQVRRRKRGRLN